MRTEANSPNIISHLLSSQARLIALLSLWLLLAIFSSSARAQAAQPVCAEDKPDDDAYMVTLCLSEPLENETLSGDVPVTVDIKVEGEEPGIQRVIFYLDQDQDQAEPLMIDESDPYTFVLPSTSYDNGVHTLSVEALMGNEFIATGPNLKVRFNNDESRISLIAIAAVLLLSLSLLAFVVIYRKRAKQA